MLRVIANCIGHNRECEHAEVEARTQDEDARWRNVTTRRQTYRGLISAMTTSSSLFGAARQSESDGFSRTDLLDLVREIGKLLDMFAFDRCYDMRPP